MKVWHYKALKIDTQHVDKGKDYETNKYASNQRMQR